MADTEEINTLIARLDVSPSRFAAALAQLEAADSVENVWPGEWSAAEVLAHVRASQDIMEPRIFAILVRDNPTLLAFDDRKWAEAARFSSIAPLESLDNMRQRRKELIRALRGAAPADWERTGTHEAKGPQSVLQIARAIADHEAEHLEQINSRATAYADANINRG
jgi:hypothetical protein